MRQIEHVQLKPIPHKGMGLVAGSALQRGELIFVIAGPIVGQPTRFTIPITPTLLIDPVPIDNFGRYLNHSCDPNAGVKKRTMVSALRDIEPGEEIAIDYAMIVDDYGDEITEEQLKCHCGSKLCRGRLGSYNSLPEALRRKYEGFISEAAQGR